MKRFNPFKSKASADSIPSVISVGAFSQESQETDLPTGWQPQTFRSIPKLTDYQLVEDDGITVIQASSQSASSGLTTKVQIDLTAHPIIQWRWKVQVPVQNCDLTQVEGDSCSARVFITFGRIVTSLRAINYVWAAGLAQGEWITSPVSNRVKLLVLRNETDPLNTWFEEERNVYEDFKVAFGDEPPKTSGVAIMTDTFRTQEAAVANYGDISFKQGDH